MASAAAASSLESGGAPGGAPSSDGDELHEIFLDYCAFGSGGSAGSDAIDNVKFSKLCRECKVIGKTLSPASVDITFSKVKAKGKRTIAYEEFQQALAMLAAEKYARLDPNDAFDKVIGLILKKGTQCHRHRHQHPREHLRQADRQQSVHGGTQAPI
jgi:hypothetical protein